MKKRWRRLLIPCFFLGLASLASLAEETPSGPAPQFSPDVGPSAVPAVPAVALPKTTKTPAPKPSSKLPPILRDIETKYAAAKTFYAKFEQNNHSVLTGKDKLSSGDIAFEHPGKIRWQTTAPLPSLLVSDGKRFWLYTPPLDETENGQVIERKSSEVQSRVAQALLSGAFSTVRGMKIETVSPTQFHLSFKGGTAGTVDSARIEIDSEKLLIRKVTLHNTDGNTSEITLLDIEPGKALEDATFTFVIPPKTDRIKN